MNKLILEQSSKDNGWDTDFNNIFKKANAVPITLILRAYGIKLNQNVKHIPCPFANRHKKGQDHTPSFNIYTNTNSFWCFGCKTGTSCVDFVSNMDNIGIIKAAEKILSLYNGDIELLDINSNIDFSKRLQILIEFSNYIRELMVNTTNSTTLLFS